MSPVNPINFDSISNLSPELQKAFQTAQLAEKKGIESKANEKKTIEAKTTLLKDLVGKVEGARGLIPNLNTPFAIRDFVVQSSDEKSVSGVADKQYALPGSYNIEILKLASSPSAVSNRFPDKNETEIGSGYLAVRTRSGEEQEIYIDPENSTLEGVAKVINRSKIGLRASVVEDASDPELPFRLVITGEGTGYKSNVEFPELYFVDGEDDFYFEIEKPAENGRILYEGNEIEVPSNEISDLISGVTLNLKGLSDIGKPIAIKVSQDIPKTIVKVKDLVEKSNQIFSFIQAQNKVDEKTDTSKMLTGDYSLRISEQRLRNALSFNTANEPNRRIRAPSDIGIQFTKQGTLTFDEKKFENALSSHFDEVVDFLTGDNQNGLIPKLSRALDSLVEPTSGVLSNHVSTEEQKTQRLNKEIERKEELSQQKLNDLRNKLAKAQTAITAMKQQMSQIPSMPQGGGGSIEGLLL